MDLHFHHVLECVFPFAWLHGDIDSNSVLAESEYIDDENGNEENRLRIMNAA